MSKFAPGRAATLTCLIAFAILISLGWWQLERRAWKTALIAEIEQRAEATPVELPKLITDIEEWRFRRVTLSGRFDHERELHLFAAGDGGGGGWRLFTPLIRDSGPPVFVDRGWVPDRIKEQSGREVTLVDGIQQMTGIVRLGQKKGVFTPVNDPQANRWYFVDLDAMALAADIPIAPRYYVELDPGADPQKLPYERHRALELSNRHLQYALTWFSLAAVLVGVYVAWGVKRAKHS